MQPMLNDARASMRKALRACTEGLFFDSSVVMNAEFRKISPAATKIRSSQLYQVATQAKAKHQAKKR